MKRVSCRAIAFVLALMTVISVFLSIPISAETDSEQFVFSALSDADHTTYPVNENGIFLPVSAQSSFSAQDLSLISGSTNAFYISLLNTSAATEIRVSYTYELYGERLTATAVHAITPFSSQKEVFVMDAPQLTRDIEELSISFHGGQAGGTLVLYAFFNISYYVPDIVNEAAFSRCHYNVEKKEIEITGELSYAATVRYEGENLALFALSEGEDLHLSSKTPIARAGVSFDFSFRVPVNNSDDIYARYVVAAVTEKGERIPLCTPTYPTLPESESAKENGFKGMYADDLGVMTDVLPDVSVVDVYLDRMQGSQSSGILYAGEYDYYYFNQEYIAELDRKIQNLNGVGSSIYLRLLIGGSAIGLSFVDDAPYGVQNRLPVIRTQEARHDLYALIDFISARYRDNDCISGMILGRSADLVDTYSYAAANDLESYSQLYAATLHLISGTARQHLPNIRIILPISDRIWAQNISSAEADGIWTELFLPSLTRALSTQILNPQSFTLMLESRAFSEKCGGETENYYGVDRLQEFLSMISDVAQQHPFLDARIFFSWLPYGNVEDDTLRAEYLYKYTALYTNSAVHGLIVDFSADGSANKLSALQYLIKHINTDLCEQASATALNTLGVVHLQDLFPNVYTSSFMTRRVFRIPLQTSADALMNVQGRFSMWDFSLSNAVQDWYAGNACDQIGIQQSISGGTHVLSATMDGRAARGELAYSFDAPTDLSFTNAMSLKLGISGKENARYEVQLQLIGRKNCFYSSAILEAGQAENFYLALPENTSTLTALQSIRITARCLDQGDELFELQLENLILYSNILNDQQLSERVDAIRQTTSEKGEQTKAKDYTVPLTVTLSLVLGSTVVVSLLWIGRKYRRKHKK